MKNKILLSLFLLLNPFFILGNNWTDDKNYAEEVNTLIGTKGLGLASGYLYPGPLILLGWYSLLHLIFQKVPVL